MYEEKFASLVELYPDVSRETFLSFCMFEEELYKWQKLTNLVSKTDVAHIWKRHILDSIQIFSVYKNKTAWLDLGSGGGFPAIVIAILMKHQGSGYINLVESNQKKAAFLQHIVLKLQLPAKVFNKRCETLSEEIKDIDIISARALANLDKLLNLSYPWLSHGAIALFPKGKDYKIELTQSWQNWQYKFKTHQSIIKSDSVILEIFQVTKKDRL